MVDMEIKRNCDICLQDKEDIEPFLWPGDCTQKYVCKLCKANATGPEYWTTAQIRLSDGSFIYMRKYLEQIAWEQIGKELIEWIKKEVEGYSKPEILLECPSIAKSAVVSNLKGEDEYLYDIFFEELERRLILGGLL